MDSLELAKAAASLPMTVLLVLVLVGGYAGWWIYGSIHRSRVDELTKDLATERARADKWEARYLSLESSVRDDDESRHNRGASRLKEGV